jgi:hypothetical protein
VRVRVLPLVLVAGCVVSGEDLMATRRWEYPGHPHLRSATGGPIHVEGSAIATSLAIPSFPGITLMYVLRVVRFTHLAAEPTVRLVRAELAVDFDPEDPDERSAFFEGATSYEVPFVAVAQGKAPDPVLAPGDLIMIERGFGDRVNVIESEVAVENR